MARAFLIVIDSVGIGGAPDAGQFFNDDVPDTGANTGHIGVGAGSNRFECAASRCLGGRDASVERQRYPLWALGIGGRAGAVAVACFPQN